MNTSLTLPLARFIFAAALTIASAAFASQEPDWNNPELRLSFATPGPEVNRFANLSRYQKLERMTIPGPAPFSVPRDEKLQMNQKGAPSVRTTLVTEGTSEWTVRAGIEIPFFDWLRGKK